MKKNLYIITISFCTLFFLHHVQGSAGHLSRRDSFGVEFFIPMEESTSSAYASDSIVSDIPSTVTSPSRDSIAYSRSIHMEQDEGSAGQDNLYKGWDVFSPCSADITKMYWEGSFENPFQELSQGRDTNRMCVSPGVKDQTLPSWLIWPKPISGYDEQEHKMQMDIENFFRISNMDVMQELEKELKEKYRKTYEEKTRPFRSNLWIELNWEQYFIEIFYKQILINLMRPEQYIVKDFEMGNDMEARFPDVYFYGSRSRGKSLYMQDWESLNTFFKLVCEEGRTYINSADERIKLQTLQAYKTVFYDDIINELYPEKGDKIENFLDQKSSLM